MAAFDQLFDEAFYLESYPDIAAVVQAGLIPSGLAHFLGAGIQEGRTLISRFYRDSDGEQRYLTANPDVAAVVGPGGLASGLQHFLGIGEIEGRSLFPGGFDEDWYRRRYPDIAQAISQGVFASGLEHYLGFGRNEQRSVSPLFELDYFDLYPDVRAAIQNPSSIYLSAADHFSVQGNREGRQATFSGTSGDDTVVGAAAVDILTGVQLNTTPRIVSGVNTGALDREYESIGNRERDVLIGGPGVDTFELGIPSSTGRSFYQGNGDLDFARIENFEPGRDRLILGTRNGPPIGGVSGTQFDVTPEGINIIALNNPSADTIGVPNPEDLIAVVAGITNLNDLLGTTTFLGTA